MSEIDLFHIDEATMPIGELQTHPLPSGGPLMLREFFLIWGNLASTAFEGRAPRHESHCSARFPDVHGGAH